MRLLYNGCWGRPGHFLYAVNGMTVGNHPVWSYDELDATLLDPERNSWKRRAEEVEGAAVLVLRRGWTLIQFWDRSGDDRGGSNSTFLAEGEHSFDEMVNLARNGFPRLFDRFMFEITRQS